MRLSQITPGDICFTTEGVRCKVMGLTTAPGRSGGRPQRQVKLKSPNGTLTLPPAKLVSAEDYQKMRAVEAGEEKEALIVAGRIEQRLRVKITTEPAGKGKVRLGFSETEAREALESMALKPGRPPSEAPNRREIMHRRELLAARIKRALGGELDEEIDRWQKDVQILLTLDQAQEALRKLEDRGGSPLADLIT